jgi:hypothetical protein
VPDAFVFRDPFVGRMTVRASTAPGAITGSSAPEIAAWPASAMAVNGKAKVSQRAEQNVATFGLA